MSDTPIVITFKDTFMRLALEMIKHATPPTPADGGEHENACSIADAAKGEKL